MSKQLTDADTRAIKHMPEGWFFWGHLPHQVGNPRFRCDRLVELGVLESKVEGELQHTLRTVYRKISSDRIPVRLQRSRKKDARLVSPNGLPIVCVTRPGKYGNPFKIGGWFTMGDPDPKYRGPFQMTYCQAFKEEPGFTKITDAAMSLDWFRRYCETTKREFSELRGKNLACWCDIGQPCHADLILTIANR